MITSLFGNAPLSRLDRKSVLLLHTGLLIISGLVVTFAADGLQFTVGRALVGIAIGGFWSLTTSIVARLVPASDLPKALALLQGGTALAALVAAPRGSFLGGIIGWRGAFFIVVPIEIAGLIWQMLALPRMASQRTISVRCMAALLGHRVVFLGMAASTVAFMGQFTLSTYFRPVLEGVTGLDVNSSSLALLGIGVAGLAGTTIPGFILRSWLKPALIALPAMLAAVAFLLLALAECPLIAGLLLVLWGLFSAPIPVAWGTWMTRVVPYDLETGGGLQVALAKAAITAGAVSGGLLLDLAGWSSAFACRGIILVIAAMIAFPAGKTLESNQP